MKLRKRFSVSTPAHRTLYCFVAIAAHHHWFYAERIPTYSASGKRIRNYSLPEVERRLAAEEVEVHRNRKGHIVAVQFLEANGESPLRKSAHMGTAYSFAEPISDYRVWKHDLHVDREDIEQINAGLAERNRIEAEVFIAGVFRAVTLSCIV